MSDTPESPRSPSPPVQRNSPLGPPSGFRLDPAAIAIGIGGLVLLLAVWWLLTTPRQTAEGGRLDQAETRLAELEKLRADTGAVGGKLEAVGTSLDARLKALESRPPGHGVDLRPLESQIAALAERAASAERLVALMGDRVTAAERALAERAQAAERRVQALEARPAIDPATVTPRQEFSALGTRVQQAGEQLAQLSGRVQAVDEAAQRRIAEYGQQDAARMTAAEQAAVQRVQALEQALRQALAALDTSAQQRVTGVEQSVGQKLATTEQTLGQRLTTTEQSLGQRLAAAEQTLGQKLTATEQAIGQRIGALEQEQKRLGVLEQRTERLATIDRIRSTLAAGQPLGDVLKPIAQPPQALARFAAVAPPTTSGLRLSFEQAVAQARAASDPAVRSDGSKGGVTESAGSRLGGLVTVRRGDQVLWGDTVESEIERARRALAAGDIELSLTFIDKLPPAPKQAMQGWVEQARALIAANAALRQLAAG